MKQERITFPNADGRELVGLLDLPEDEKPVAYVLFAHCFTCTKNLAAAANICRALTRRRMAVLRFDFTGLGESEGDFADTNFSTNVSDLVDAARFIEKEYAAPRILVGHSLGGTAALMAAGLISSVAAVATIAAPSHPRHIAKILNESREEIERSGKATVRLAGRDFTIRKQFLDDLEEQESIGKMGRIDAALMVMHSPRDRIVGIENAAEIYRAARHPKNFISLDPADHLLSRKEDSVYAGDVIATWAGRYIVIGEETDAPVEVTDNRVTSRTGKEGFRTDLFANGHSLIVDEPQSFGGTGLGPSPYDLLQAALGACTGMTVQMYARRKGWPLEEAVVRLHHEKVHAEDCVHCEEKGRKIDRFERELELKGNLDEDQRRRLLEIAEKCPVHRTLNSEVLIETRLKKEGKN